MAGGWWVGKWWGGSWFGGLWWGAGDVIAEARPALRFRTDSGILFAAGEDGGPHFRDEAGLGFKPADAKVRFRSGGMAFRLEEDR